MGRLPPESINNIWAHSLLAQILNKKAYEFGKVKEIEFEYIMPLLIKQNNQIQKRLIDFCEQSKKYGYRTDLNGDTFKSLAAIL
jgi:hypothetical protein